MENTEQKIDESVSSINRDDVIKEFMESKDFIDLINAEKGKAVENFKQEKLPELVTKEIELRNHKEPWQIQMEEMQRKMAAIEKEKAAEVEARIRGENKAKALKVFSDKGLPSDFIDFVVDVDEEKMNKNVELAVGVFENYAKSLKQGMLKDNNTHVPGKDETISSSGLQVPGDNASQKEWEEYYRKKKKLNK